MNLINQACDTLSIIERQDKKYHNLNRTIRNLQGDFSTHLHTMDDNIQSAVIDLLDNILDGELASYWLYECVDHKDGGLIVDNGKEFRIKSIGDVKRYARYLAKVKSNAD